MRLVLLHERADRGQRPEGAAREVDGQGIGGGPECRHERHPDDRADAAFQDAEPVAGLGRLRQPVADHHQDRHLHSLPGQQPGRGYRPARRGQRAAGHEQDRVASGPQRAAAGGGPSHHAQVPGGTQQRGQRGHAGPAVRADQHDLARWRIPRPGGRHARTLPGRGRHRIHAASFAARMSCADVSGLAIGESRGHVRHRRSVSSLEDDDQL
jgi:hypothetical protein